MGEYNIKPGDRIVCFGQLLGMCDYISFYLGKCIFKIRNELK